MAIRVKVRRNRQIIVPVRFARAVSGAPVVDAPDVDDRGFAMGARPGTWGSSDTRGAMVAVTEGDTIRVKVVREDLDGTAPLFMSSTNPSVADISGPAALPPDDVFSLIGVKDTKNAAVKIQVHLGAVGGPVIGELEPHIFQLHQVRVRAHLVTINGAATVRTAAGLVPLFDAVNVIWRAAGIEFLYDQTQTRTGSINGFATAGTVTTNLGAGQFREFSRVLNLRDPPGGDPGPDANAVNVYFVQLSSDPASNWTGLTLDRDSPRPDGFGVVLLDRGNAHELAHELGHFLDLDFHAGESAPGTHIRDDVESERRMMFDFSPLDVNQPAHRHDVSYGNLVPGELIDLKDFGADPTDGAVARSRRRSLNPF